MDYYSTFPAGLQAVAKEIIKAQFPKASILQVMDGAIVYAIGQAPTGPQLAGFASTYLVLDRRKWGPEPSLDGYARRLLKYRVHQTPVVRRGMGRKSKAQQCFRLMILHQNTPSALAPELRRQMEQGISQGTGMSVNRSQGDAEFYLLSRREGHAYFLKKLSMSGNKPEALPKGALHGDLAYMMNWLSGPLATDRMLDPFCGYGSIPIQRALHFPAQSIHASDRDSRALAIFRQRLGSLDFSRRPGAIQIQQGDCIQLARAWADESVDTVVTDPPWGLYDGTGDTAALYGSAMAQWARQLKPGGRLVLLTACQDIMHRLLEEHTGSGLFSLERDDSVLVSGKKAHLYKLLKG